MKTRNLFILILLLFSSQYIRPCSVKKPMVWTDQHNEVLLQEMDLFEPWKYKRGSKREAKFGRE